MRCNKNVQGGFSFCGVDIADLGLSYVPENEDTYVYRPAEINVNEELFDGHDGGYFYGVTKQPKEFNLRCYFEDDTIDHGIMERIQSLFRLGKQGKLIFSRRPWCYYYATVTSLPHPELASYNNGLITISMKAYYPVARGDELFYNAYAETEEETDRTKDNLVYETTALLESENMVPPKSFVDLVSANHNETYSFILHNPGTEYAPLSIIASGDVGEGITIRNKTTNQECRIIAMDKKHTSNVSKFVYIDGINGHTTLIGNDFEESAFVYHDSGFISLEPAYPMIRNVYVESSDTDTITVINSLNTNVEGMYIFLDNDWYKIEEQIDDHVLRLDRSASTANTRRTIITRMNEFEIIPDNTMELTHLSFSFKPTYA